MKTIYIILSVIFAAFSIFIIGILGFEWNKYFMPKYQNLNRQVFENTQSYVQGKTQDLSRYYDQYSNAKNESDKEIIRNIIKMQFTELDANKLQSQPLKTFLISMRGY